MTKRLITLLLALLPIALQAQTAPENYTYVCATSNPNISLIKDNELGLEYLYDTGDANGPFIDVGGAALCNTTRITPGVPTSPTTRTAPSHRLTNYRLLSVFKINITKVGRYRRNILPLRPLSLLLRVPCPMQRHGICLKHDTPAYHFRLELSALATLAQQQEKGEGVRRQKGKVVEEMLCNKRCKAFGINRRHAHIVSKHTQHS